MNVAHHFRVLRDRAERHEIRISPAVEAQARRFDAVGKWISFHAGHWSIFQLDESDGRAAAFGNFCGDSLDQRMGGKECGEAAAQMHPFRGRE